MADRPIAEVNDEALESEETLLDVIARWIQAFWLWLGRTGRSIGRWVKKRARIAWVERHITLARAQRAHALQQLGESVYKTFRHEAMGRPELLEQMDQIERLEHDIARRRRMLDMIEREEIR